MGRPVEVSFELSVADLPADHPAVDSAIEDLRAEARAGREVIVEELVVSAPGEKGAVIKWVAKALTPGGDSAIVRLFELWLGRDRRRSAEVTISVPGSADPTVIKVTLENGSLEALSKALEVASEAIARETT